MNLAKLEQFDLKQWQTLAADVSQRLETRLFIDGKHVDAIAGGRFATVNPRNGETLAQMSEGMPADIDLAVSAAKRAYRSGVWSKMAPRERMDILYRFTRLIDEHAGELAVLDTLDMGKPIADMVSIDLPSVIETIQFLTEGIDKLEGTVTNTDDDAVHMILREPLGVVGCISPWNYPLLIGNLENSSGTGNR